MRIYKTESALFSETYRSNVGLFQVVTARNSLLEKINAQARLPINSAMIAIAFNLYAGLYEKNPNPLKRAEALADEFAGLCATKQFQKASQCLDIADPDWEVPVFGVAWPKQISDINTIIGNPMCSKCNNELKSIGNLFINLESEGARTITAFLSDGTAAYGYRGTPDYDQWSGTICPNCDLIFCPNCLDRGGKDPCPVCNNRVIPAFAKDLPIKQTFLVNASSQEKAGGIKTPDPNQDNTDTVIFVREIKKQRDLAPVGEMSTYMIYRANSAQFARDFLTKKIINDHNLFIIVQTPEGNFGKNKDGIYKE